MTRAKPEELTEKQKIFILEYVNCKNAKEAAIAAGYSPASAKTQGCELMKQEKIREEIDRRIEKLNQKLEISGEKVLKRLDDIGDLDPGLAYDDDGCLLPIKEMPVAVRKSIKKIKVFEKWDFATDPVTGEQKKMKTGEVIDVEFWDKVKSNELIGKNQKLFNEKIEVEHSGSISQLTDEEIEAKIQEKLRKRSK